MSHILLIEDNPGDARLIGELLKESTSAAENHVIFHVERVGDAVGILTKPDHAIDIILSDITLPDSSGADTLLALGTAGAELPVIFMTGTNNETLAVEAMKQGAQDYLVKGRFDGDSLSKAIIYAVERKKFQKELSAIHAKANANQQRADLLTQQKKQLVALTKAKDEFISLASHQLRTPATAVKQYLGMIVEGYVGDVDEEIFKIVQTAFDSNNRQLEVINELLKTAQLDANSYHLHIATHDMNQLIHKVVKNIHASTELRHQDIHLELIDDATARFDYDEMCLVLENIVGNASKYSPPQKPIRITMKRTPGWLRVSIKDEGVGIDKADQRRVFDKFTRIDNALSDTVSGNGLGLYWVKRIMKLHGGTIRLQSELSKGTEFTLNLPI